MRSGNWSLERTDIESIDSIQMDDTLRRVPISTSTVSDTVVLECVLTLPQTLCCHRFGPGFYV